MLLSLCPWSSPAPRAAAAPPPPSCQAAMVLVFMFSASWRLTVVTFVMIPLVLVVCKVGGGVWVEGQGAKPSAQTAETAHTMACRTLPSPSPRVGVAVLFCCALPPVRSARGPARLWGSSSNLQGWHFQPQHIPLPTHPPDAPYRSCTAPTTANSARRCRPSWQRPTAWPTRRCRP